MQQLVGSETLLVVEDEPAVRTLVTTVLRTYGFEVLEADGAEAAVELTKLHGPPDLLITDVVMPVTNGPELAGQLRAVYPELRVLYMSGYPWDKLNQAWRVSNVALLEKPFTMDGLVAAVREALPSRYARRSSRARWPPRCQPSMSLSRWRFSCRAIRLRRSRAWPKGTAGHLDIQIVSLEEEEAGT